MGLEVVAKVIAIAYDEEHDGYVVQFWVGQEMDSTSTIGDALRVLSKLDGLQRDIYSFLVRWEEEEFTMEPDEGLAECLSIFDEHEDPTNLGSPLDRQWKTGQVAEALVSHLVNANTFGVWRTVEEGVEGPNLLLGGLMTEAEAIELDSDDEASDDSNAQSTSGESVSN